MNARAVTPELNLDEGPWPSEPAEGLCDLVMKGGVTSGVVYPGAILKLAKRFRFRNIGGTSAGAIAAVATAACEYGRRAKAAGAGSEGGFEQLRALATQVVGDRFVLGVFQPRPAARGAYNLALEWVTSTQPPLARARALLSRLFVPRIRDELWNRRLALVVGGWLWVAFVLLLGVAVLQADAFARLVSILLAVLVGVLGIVGLAVIVAVAVVVAAVAAARPVVDEARQVFALLDEEGGFGLCPGTSQPGFTNPALSDWLHEQIQLCAGRKTTDPALTFADLVYQGDPADDRSILLQLVTTDLSAGRPVKLPLSDDPDENPYLFEPADLVNAIPSTLVNQMVAAAGEPQSIGGKTLYRLPGGQMPVLLGARLSLSFPVLLSAIRLYTAHESAPDGLVEHWFSDGGISSNFPIHFFDSLLPKHPTFGLDLIGYPNEELGQLVSDTSDDPTLHHVYLPTGPKAPLPLRWSRVTGLGGFFKQMFDSARNWRDTMQMELPGFRERICHIRLSQAEGGLNLNMAPDVVQTLVSRGTQAGEAFTGFQFPKHRFTRYLTMMQMLERELQKARSRFGYDDAGTEYPGFRNDLTAGIDDDEYPYENARNEQWRTEARAATQELLDAAAGWGKPEPPASLGFARAGQTPAPEPALRITPQI